MVSQKHGDPICKPSFGIAAYLVAPPLVRFLFRVTLEL
jgi:hypothetical protein